MINNSDQVVIKDIAVTFSRWGQNVDALKSVSFSVPKGQWVILTGHNGSGKSTLLRAISSRIKPNLGEILLNGVSVEKMTPHQLERHVFQVHQDPLLGTASKLTLYENLLISDYEANHHHNSTKVLRKKYYDLLIPLGLHERLNQLVGDFSGGERQQITILIASLRPSELILLDEPLKALDPARTQICIEQIKMLHKIGKTLIQVSHDLDFIEKFSDRIIELKEGVVLSDGLKTNNVEERTIN
jgi:putative tryptophan/tyrosine transport system ATP-binding protein